MSSIMPLRHRVFSAFALWLGLAALLIQGLAPLCLSGAMAATRDGGTTIVICTVHGPETIRLGGDGAPAPSGSVHDGSDCALCAAFHNIGAFTPAAPGFVQADLTSPTQIVIARTVPVLSVRAHFTYATRAPPVSAVSLTVQRRVVF